MAAGRNSLPAILLVIILQAATMPQAAAFGTPVTHVLFDMDGLLLDTERVYSVVTQQIVGRYGKTFGWDVKKLMMGRRAQESAEVLIRELQVPMTPDEYIREREELQDKMWGEVDVMPGAEKLVRHLKALGIPQGVATSSNRPAFEAKTAKHQALFSLFDVIVTGDDSEVTMGKPSPDIFNVCAKRLPNPPADPKKCLVFEDAILGIQAAQAAGMYSVLVPDPNMEEDERTGAGASQVLTSLENFKPEDWGLPPY
mmetsp:Transcript_652/g.1599  ORF Transcript_652/g.1599 Transcript_652/m.1599 type:complete len:255 (+) Transcript_652:33-797(+)